MSIVFGSEDHIKGPDNFACAISEHPIPAMAVGEVVGELMEKVGEGADLVCVFVSASHAGALEDVVAAVHTLLDPKVMIGCAAAGVICADREVVGSPAVSVWAGNVGPVAPVRLEVVDMPTGGKALKGWPIDLDYVPAGAVLITDPYGFPTPALFEVLNKAGGFPRVVGGMAAAGEAAGTSRLVLNDSVYADGAVGVLMGVSTEVWMETVVAQGVRPVGAPFVATKAEANVIVELGGEPAYRRLAHMVRDELESSDLDLAEGGLLIGKVVDEHLSEFGPGDFAVRSVLDSNAWEGTITVGERIETGTTVQFQLPDPEWADAALRASLMDKSAHAGLLFTDVNRGRGLFGVDDHDATAVREVMGSLPIAGFVSEGTYGPSHRLNVIHGMAATLGLFGPPEVLEPSEAPQKAP